MDVARYGPFAANREYIRQTTGQFYSRRFVMTYPNEQLPAGRPLKMAPAYSEMAAAGARWGCSWGLEVPLYFAPEGFDETPTLKRSNAHPIVAEECRAVREAVGLLDISGFSRFEVTGPRARAWLDRLLASRLPKPGRARLAPMLSPEGRLKGDLTLFDWGDGTLVDHGLLLPARMAHALVPGPPGGRRHGARRLGCAGRVRDHRATVARGPGDADPRGRLQRRLPLHELPGDGRGADPRPGRPDLGGGRARLRDHTARPPSTSGSAARCWQAGAAAGIREFGYQALLSLRLEKSFGIWSAEFRQEYTPRHDRDGSLDRLDQGRLHRARRRTGRARRAGPAAAPGDPGDRGRRCRRERLRAGLVGRPPGRLHHLGRLWAHRRRVAGDGAGRAGAGPPGHGAHHPHRRGRAARPKSSRPRPTTPRARRCGYDRDAGQRGGAAPRTAGPGRSTTATSGTRFRPSPCSPRIGWRRSTRRRCGCSRSWA